MAVIRPNIINDAAARKKYCDGVKLLKNEFTGPTTRSLGIAGATQKVSTYDLFVIWHHTAMMTFTPATQMDRNSAHRGPVFLPWHRFMLRQLELNLQRVLSDANFGLPYWDWAADGELPVNQQTQSPLWAADGIGGSGTPVTTGPFVFKAADPKSFRVRVLSNSSGTLRQVNRGLSRQLGQGIAGLPKKAQTTEALTTVPYDSDPWNTQSDGFRNVVEGWATPPAGLHNRVHVWVGGDMSPASSPNDPVFFLNHCNVDRIWEAWMQKNGRVYLPGEDAPAELEGHRIKDELSSLISAPATPSEFLDVQDQYKYDSMDV